jgi:3-hydroxyisobutyrate dehydrogenase
MTRVGWIGLGAMGSPMAACVARAGHATTAFDLDPARAAALEGDGVVAAASAADAARDADVVVLMVATPDQVEAVLLGEPAVADALAPGTVAVIMATVGPAPMARWAQTLADREVEVVDAPVSGGVLRAADGDLLIMVSGAGTAVERARPLLDAMARTVAVVGEAPGDGQKVKLVNQLLCGVHIAAAAEALAFAESLGLDPGETLEVVRGGAAQSFMLEDRGPRMVAGAFEQPRSALDIFVKDMGLVTEAAGESGFQAPLARTAQALYDEGRDAGLGRMDDASVIDVLRGRADES